MSKRKTRAQKMARSVKALTAYSAGLEVKNRALRRENDILHDGTGVQQLNQTMDATLVSIASVYGVPVTDDDDGTVIGYRMEIPMPHISVLCGRRVQAEKFEAEDGSKMLRIGVIIEENTDEHTA